MGQHSSRDRVLSSRHSEERHRLMTPDPEHMDGSADCVPLNPNDNLPIYQTIHRIRKEVIDLIDDPYSIEQLRDPRMNISVVRPLVDRLYEQNDVSMIYCLLVNRTQFLREQLTQPHQQSVCTTRALLCEIVANRILRRVHELNPDTQGLLLLAQILVGGFDPFQGAPPEVVQESSFLAGTFPNRTGYKRRLPAIEIAIISQSKSLLSSSACQRVVNAIYEGRVVYTPTAFIDILPDHYKHKPISLYNPRKAPLLDQYRLIVPRTRNTIEVCQFLILLALYISVMAERDPSRFGGVEFMFIIYTLGWSLDQLASILEHGWKIYSINLWSFLDVTFILIYSIYVVLRVHGWRTDSLEQGQQAMDVLAMGAPVLVPRLAFNLMSENMLFISLRSMMRDFTVLSFLAIWCFTGFLLSMTWLSDGKHSIITISKWMLWVWFGLDGTGIQRSVDFHRLLGPTLMVLFAFLGNTLFLTLTVAMLSTSFSTIVSNATAEIQFRRAVLTLEGVKSDAIFAYIPPFNIPALIILLPLKFVLTPRWFHKINVAAVRTLNAPFLLIIGFIERRTLWAGSRHQRDRRQNSRSPGISSLWDFRRGFSVHGDIQAVFDVEPPQALQDELANEEGPNHHELEHEYALEFQSEPSMPKLQRTTTSKSRRDSVYPFEGVKDQLRDLLNEGASDDEDNSDVRERLEALEKSNLRIEAMLGKLCQVLDEVPLSRSGSAREGETGTMKDLDVSGNAELDE